MTITEVTKQIHKMAVGGFINGEKFTLERFSAYAKNMLRGSNSFIFEICLPDGRWLAKVNRYGEKPDQYDYYIPDSRIDEMRLKEEFTKRS